MGSWLVGMLLLVSLRLSISLMDLREPLLVQVVVDAPVLFLPKGETRLESKLSFFL